MDILKLLNGYSSTDILFIVVIILSAVLAFLNGAVREGLSLSKWILSALISKKYLYLLDHYANIQPLVVKQLVGFCLVFILLSLLFQLINVAVNHFIKFSGIGLLNKLLGMLFGAGRGIIVCAIATLIIPFLMPNYNVHDSKLFPVLSPALEMVVQYKTII